MAAEAKPSYKIPFGLKQSYADMTISLSAKDGSVARGIPFMVAGTILFSVIGCFFLLTQTFIGSMSNMFQKVLFVILWAALTFVLVRYDGTHRMNAQRIMSLLNYLPRSARYVFTRDIRNAGPLWTIVGIKDMTEDGTTTFADGTYGHWYRIVGSASILLFDTDKDAIISRVDRFYQKWPVDTEISFITAKESQKVYHQLSALARRYEGLRNDDPDLRNVAEEQFKILRDYVGKEFRSIHQYMLVKSNSMEGLRSADAILQNEIDNSSLMIKQCVPLERDEVYEFLRSIYRKGE